MSNASFTRERSLEERWLTDAGQRNPYFALSAESTALQVDILFMWSFFAEVKLEDDVKFI